MYVCECCDYQVGPGKKLNRFVVERRKKEYVQLVGYNQIPVVVGYGTEIVREASLCDKCCEGAKLGIPLKVLARVIPANRVKEALAEVVKDRVDRVSSVLRKTGKAFRKASTSFAGMHASTVAVEVDKVQEKAKKREGRHRKQVREGDRPRHRRKK